MTRKDFELIAAVLLSYNRMTSDGENAVVQNMAFAFAEKLKATNKQFNRATFLHACGVHS